MNYSSLTPAFLFDVDRILVDSVYQHVLGWREALESCRTQLSVGRIHRRTGMSGGLFTAALFWEPGRALLQEQIEQLQRRHAQASACSQVAMARMNSNAQAPTASIRIPVISLEHLGELGVRSLQ